MADEFGNLNTSSRIPIFDNEDEIDKAASQFKSGKPEAYLLYNGTEEYRDENNIDKINSVINCDILIYFIVKDTQGQENDRVQEQIRLKNVVLNAIYTDRTRDSNATTLVVDGEAIWGTEVGEITTEEIKAPMFKMRIPVKCSFQHTATGR